MEKDFQFWGPFQVKTAKAPKKGVLVETFQKLLEINSKNTVISAQCWCYPDQNNDKNALQAIMCLPNVKEVCIYGRNSDTVQKVKINLPPLNILRCSQCLLTEIPPWIYTNVSVTQLNLISNKISKVPQQLGMMANLKQLYLFENELTQFPMVILKLTNLQKLHLNNNKIPSIPEQIGVWKNLNQLFIGNNPDLKVLPKIIFTGLKALKSFSAIQTPWYSSPGSKQKLNELKRRGIIIV